jgi:hypothetical protein
LILLPVLDRQDRVHRHRVGDRVALLVAHRLAVLADDDDLGLELVALGRGAPVGHDLLGHAGGIVGLLADRHAETRSTNFAVPAFSAMIGSV